MTGKDRVGHRAGAIVGITLAVGVATMMGGCAAILDDLQKQLEEEEKEEKEERAQKLWEPDTDGTKGDGGGK